MRSFLKAFAVLVLLVVIAGALGVWYVVRAGVSARAQPGRIEEFMALRVRNLAIVGRAGSLNNPVERSAEVIADGLAHFADHCAICHANDGSGQTPIGQGLWPKAPDLRLARTQDLSDGELFWIIENGIRFTGMPGWGTGTPEGELASWHLVHFVRHLPNLTPEELEQMEALNPRPPEEIRQRMAEDEFLRGGAPPSGERSTPHKHPGGHND